MYKLFINFFLIFAIAITISSCGKNDGSLNGEPVRVLFKFKFDSTQTRLNNLGLPTSIGVGKGALSPRFNKIAAHYFELSPNEFTALGAGAILYKAPEITTGGPAIDFDKAIKKGNDEDYFAKAIREIVPGTYSYIRVSLSYQNYDIDYKSATGTIISGTLASFIGYNTFITSFPIKTVTQNVNATKLQGYWAFESQGFTVSGQAPPGATTVPNPIFATSPIPAGSCVVTAAFVDSAGVKKPLKITGTETQDIVVTLSLSTNKSFEWNEIIADGLFEPSIGETVIDMGIRGMKPVVK
jgi:hypothetical protein